MKKIKKLIIILLLCLNIVVLSGCDFFEGIIEGIVSSAIDDFTSDLFTTESTSTTKTTKSTTESTTKSTTESTSKSTTRSTTESTTRSTTESTTKSTTASTTKSTTKSTTESTTKSTTKSTSSTSQQTSSSTISISSRSYSMFSKINASFDIDEGNAVLEYYTSLSTWENYDDLISKLHTLIISNKNSLIYVGNNENNEDADKALDDFEMYDALYTTNYLPFVVYDTDGKTPTAVNKEHAFCASLMTGEGTGTAVETLGRATDFLNLFASEKNGNTSRGNKCYGDADETSKSYKESSDYTSTNGYDGYAFDTLNFEPGDKDKGRLARAIFYMVVMYNEDTYKRDSYGNLVSTDGKLIDSEGYLISYRGTRLADSKQDGVERTPYVYKGLSVQEDYVVYDSANCAFAIGNLSDLLNWAIEFSVDRLEYQHNQSVYEYEYNGVSQNNRNPFVDYPELVEYVFGSKKGQSGSLIYLTSSYESLEIYDDSTINNYAIKQAPRRYDEGSVFDYDELEIVAVYNNFDIEPYKEFVVKVNGEVIDDDSVLTISGTYTFTIETSINTISYEVIIETDEVKNASYVMSLKNNGKNKESVFYGKLSNPGEEIVGTFNDVSWTFVYDDGVVEAYNATFGTQFGTSKNPCTKLTIESNTAFNNISGIFFRGGCKSGNSLKISIYVNDVLINDPSLDEYNPTYIDEDTPINSGIHLDTPLNGKIKIVIENPSGHFYLKYIAVKNS